MANGHTGVALFNLANSEATEPCTLGNQHLGVTPAFTRQFDVLAKLFQKASILGKDDGGSTFRYFITGHNEYQNPYKR